ncbi:hypothetical protein [Agrobacterium tumefaciens]|uniref:hypothetical protein n=1 Tax=Agrobacterium tumefaciens TaxID=358 RepID=UPI003BA1ADE4
MLARFGAALAAGIAAALSAIGSFGKWSFQVARGIVRLPFDLLGGGQPMPAPYEPEVRQSDILDEFIEARKRAAEVHTLDRDGISTVIEYCHTHREDRPRFALPKTLDKDVLVALRTMNDKALRALATAGVGKMRKFIDGRDHGIPGVPSVGKAPVKVEERPPAGLTESQRILWKVEARLRKAQESAAFEPFAVCKP